MSLLEAQDAVLRLREEPSGRFRIASWSGVGEWRKAAEPVTKVWADGARKAGVDPDAALAELKASLTKYNALQ